MTFFALLALGLGAPRIAHASDMGLVVPVLFLPVEGIASLVFLALGLVGRTCQLEVEARMALRFLALLVGTPAVLMTFVALSYLGGAYSEHAALCVGGFGLMAGAYWVAHVATRRGLRA